MYIFPSHGTWRTAHIAAIHTLPLAHMETACLSAFEGTMACRADWSGDEENKWKHESCTRKVLWRSERYMNATCTIIIVIINECRIFVSKKKWKKKWNRRKNNQVNIKGVDDPTSGRSVQTSHTSNKNSERKSMFKNRLSVDMGWKSQLGRMLRGHFVSVWHTWR